MIMAFGKTIRTENQAKTTRINVLEAADKNRKDKLELNHDF